MNATTIRWHHKPKETVNVFNAIKSAHKVQTYVVYNPATKLTKIGRSTNYELRIQTIESKLLTRLIVICVINADYELVLHKMYKYQRVIDEWFNLSNENHVQIRNKFL